MADKEFLLGVKARELLKYTKQATKVVSDDISPQDVRAILHKIAALEDIRDAREVCSQAINAVDRKQKEGFTKTAFRFYGQDMREIAKQILLDVHAANNTHFLTEYDGDTHALRSKIAEQVGAIIGETLQPRRKITASPFVRQLRRLKQQRRSQPNPPPEALAPAPRPDWILPWE